MNEHLERARKQVSRFTPECVKQPVRWVRKHTLHYQRLCRPSYRRNARRLEAYRGLHGGERCFIIGNGPSLNQTDLARLRGETTFALNRGYLYFDRIGAPTTYLVTINRYVIEQFAHEMETLPCSKFTAWTVRNHLPNASEFLLMNRLGRGFCGDAKLGVCDGSTVTYTALQLAYYMGFRQVVLIGVDHRFETKGQAHELVTSESDDPNHFDPSYFGRGIRWQLPDLAGSETAYRLADDSFRANGREIVDATIDGKLTVFPKVDYDSLFRNGGP